MNDISIIMEMNTIEKNDEGNLNCDLYLYFRYNNKLVYSLNEVLKSELQNQKMKMLLREFNSIYNLKYENYAYEPLGHYIVFQSKTFLMRAIKKMYLIGLNSNFPTYIKVFDKYFYINKENTELFEEYENIYEFIINNVNKEKIKN